MKEDRKLNQLLREAKLECEIPTDFQSQVWQKIALGSDQRQGRGLAGFLDSIREQLLQPRFGFSLAGVVVLAGFTLGHFQASSDARQAWSSLEGKYVASIDPYAQAGHGSH